MKSGKTQVFVEWICLWKWLQILTIYGIFLQCLGLMRETLEKALSINKNKIYWTKPIVCIFSISSVSFIFHQLVWSTKNIYLFSTYIYIVLRPQVKSAWVSIEHFFTSLTQTLEKWQEDLNVFTETKSILQSSTKHAYIYIYIYIVYQLIFQVDSVQQWSGRLGFYPRLSHTKDFQNGTWYLLT